jgi:hypothetical protein
MSKFLTGSAQFEGKIAYKTSYFGCLSNSSKKNKLDMGNGGVVDLGNSSDRNINQMGNNFGSFVGALEISPPNLHKSVSCFDPVVPQIEIPSLLSTSNIFNLVPSLNH